MQPRTALPARRSPEHRSVRRAEPGGGEQGLLERARSGDQAAFRDLFFRHGPAVRRFLGGLCGDPAAADDATQETFLRAWGALRLLRDPDRLRPWLLGIARIVWLDAGKRERREARGPGLLAAHGERNSISPERNLLDGEADAVLAAALEQLPPRRRMVLLLRLDHGLSYLGIAEALGWPLHKVKNEVHRARLAIRGELLAYLGGVR